MIAKEDYKFVGGDLATAKIDGSVITLRQGDSKRDIRAEDIAYIAEATRARDDCALRGPDLFHLTRDLSRSQIYDLACGFNEMIARPVLFDDRLTPSNTCVCSPNDTPSSLFTSSFADKSGNSAYYTEPTNIERDLIYPYRFERMIGSLPKFRRVLCETQQTPRISVRYQQIDNKFTGNYGIELNAGAMTQDVRAYHITRRFTRNTPYYPNFSDCYEYDFFRCEASFVGGATNSACYPFDPLPVSKGGTWVDYDDSDWKWGDAALVGRYERYATQRADISCTVNIMTNPWYIKSIRPVYLVKFFCSNTQTNGFGIADTVYDSWEEVPFATMSKRQNTHHMMIVGNREYEVGRSTKSVSLRPYFDFHHVPIPNVNTYMTNALYNHNYTEHQAQEVLYYSRIIGIWYIATLRDEIVTPTI